MTDNERYRSARRDSSQVVIEGFHALKHAIRFGAVLGDVVTDDAAALFDLARALAPDVIDALRDLPVRTLPAVDLAALSPSPNPTRVMALAARPVHDVAAILAAPGSRPVVVLDQPRHAGNIGAAVRVAAAAGAAGLITTGPTDPWSAAAVRGGAGLQFALPVVGVNSGEGIVSDGMRALLGTQRRIVAVDPAGVDLKHGFAEAADAAGTTNAGYILVFGSERDGISRDLLDRADLAIRIPMRDGVSSLNLATAVAIILYGYGPPFGIAG